MSDEVSDDGEVISVSESGSRKKRKYGSIFEASKKLRNSTYETGLNCHCTRFRCFENVSNEERKTLICHFNSLSDRNAQNAYLSGLISVNEIKQRRPRQAEQDAKLHSFSYAYKVRVSRESCLQDIPVCFKGFLSIFGITNRRAQTLKSSLASTGSAPIDKRGKHENRGKNKLPETTYTAMDIFFKSLKGRKAHYSLKDSKRLYLPEDLNYKKLMEHFLQKNLGVEISYEKFRQHAQNHYNFAFGYPRTDTCSTCDAQKAQETNIETLKTKVIDLNEIKELDDQLKTLRTEMELHKRKADSFYVEKRSARKHAMKNKEFEAITMDYGKNLPIPNITTGEVYYKRQLSFYMFNIHILSNGSSTFYTYDQTVAKKGSDDVASMLYHFFMNILDPEIREIHIFCDSCGGQNKNKTIIKFLHYVTVNLKRFDKITVTYPIRGHSYMECDKNVALINQKTPAETPEDWRNAIVSARVKPSPFNVVECTKDMFYSWGKCFSAKYQPKFKAETRPIKQLIFRAENTQTVQHRDTYNGAFISTVVVKIQRPNHLQEVQLEKTYQGLIPLSKEKFKDLQSLKIFCRQDAQEFFDSLPHQGTGCEDVDDEEGNSDF